MERKTLFWHGYLLLLAAFSLGILAAGGAPPSGAAWMRAHVSTIVGSLVLLAAASAWNELTLSEGQQRWAFRLLLVASYAGTFFNVAGAALQIPGPATQPGVQPEGLQAVVIFGSLALIIPGFFGSTVLMLLGLRGRRG